VLPSARMLLFFDIDATLITTDRSGVHAMERSGRELFGPDFTVERTEFSGRLDPLILADLLRDNGLAVTEANLAAMREGYRRHLPALLETRRCQACPGVMSLLDELDSIEGLALGLLTGNYADTGCIKLRRCGIDPARFALHVWGDESPHDPPRRDHLPEIGLSRYRERFGRGIEPRHVTIIGDTPYDVSCARAHGCRALGVATGQYGVEQLHAAGADLSLPNLADTARVLAWLLNGEPAPASRA
jgi:phosphoglycolate phosphatase